MAASRKTALIFGVSGQDGAYLAELLLDKGYNVHGASRDAEVTSFARLERLGIAERVHLHSALPTEFRSVISLIHRIEPDEIYNLAGPSSVGLSFQQPAETLEAISLGVLNVLEAIRMTAGPIRYFNAASSECFGDTGASGACEEAPFRPRSPYAVAKSTAFWQVANYREAYGVFCCSGLLFNHESPLRPARFVTRKIVRAAARIAAGLDDHVELGLLDVRRDWGWAPEYVEAMWRMLQQDEPEDFVIATGQSHSLKEFTAAAFEHFGLDWERYVRQRSDLYRPLDIQTSCGDASKAAAKLGWRASITLPQMVPLLAAAETVT